MSMVAFDTLKLARRLREAGMPPEQAEAVADAEAEALGEFVLSNLATKADIAEVKGEIADLRGELKGEIADLRGELKGEIADLRGEIAKVEGKVAEARQDIADLRGELGKIDARFEKMDRKFTIYFTVILFTMIFLNQSALEFIARLFGLLK